VQAALHETDSAEQLVAQRVLEDPALWQQWESEHSMLMRQLSRCGAPGAQVTALKQASLRLLHGTALFRYLRQSTVRGAARVRIVAHFRPGRCFESALVTEHGVYLRKACSYLCTGHLGREVVRDPAFEDPLQRYEELYREYFSVYCGTLVQSAAGGAASQRSLLPLLKLKLNEYRRAILDPPAAQPFLKRERLLRTPTGDTQRIAVRLR
jgi:hypothetical protein